MARRWLIGLTLSLTALAFGSACGGDDDDGATLMEGGVAGISAGTGGTGGRSGSGAGGGMGGIGGGTSGVSGAAGIGGTGGEDFAGTGGFGMGGFSGFPMGGFGGFGGFGGGIPVGMCPVDKPVDGSACTGRRLNCMFGNINCLCRRGEWTCDSPDPTEMDAGL